MTWLLFASGPLPWYADHRDAATSRLTPEPFSIEVDVGPGTTTVVIAGELDLQTMPLLAERLALIRRGKPGRLVFDMARTGFMDCGSARLIAATGRWLPPGRRPVVRRPAAAVRRVLELTGLDACCEIEC